MLLFLVFLIFEVPVPKSVVPNVGTSYVWCVLLLRSYLCWFLSLCYSINGVTPQGWVGWKSLKAPILRVPLCGANKETVAKITVCGKLMISFEETLHQEYFEVSVYPLPFIHQAVKS